MIHPKIISRIIGVLLLIEAGLMLLCGLMPLFMREDDLFAFMASALIAGVAGMGLLLFGKKARHEENIMTRRDGYIVVAITWVVFSEFGCMPYFLSRYIQPFLLALLLFLELADGYSQYNLSRQGMALFLYIQIESFP